MIDDWRWYQWVGSAALTVALFFMGAIQKQISSLRSALGRTNERIADTRETYATRAEMRDELKAMRSEINAGFDRLAGEIKGLREDLRRKADRSHD